MFKIATMITEIHQRMQGGGAADEYTQNVMRFSENMFLVDLHGIVK